MKLAAVGSNCIGYYVNLDGGRPYPGGGPVNMAVYTVRLGGEASYTGPVGTDAYGELMVKAATAKGVDISRMRKVPGRTAVTQVELQDGERVFCGYDEGVLDGYVLSEEDFAFLCTHDVVVCDTWGRVQKQFRELRARGIATAFDCSTRPGSPVSQEVMPYTDYLFFSAKGSRCGPITPGGRRWSSPCWGRRGASAGTGSASTSSALCPVRKWWTPWGRETATSPGSSPASGRAGPSREPWSGARPAPRRL